MKDAKGHGSNSRGGQQAAQQWRAAHQQGIMKKLPGLIAAFAKDTSGATPLNEEDERELATKEHSPEGLGRLLGESLHSLTGVDPTSAAEGAKMFAHLLHFVALLGGLAIVSVVGQALAGAPIWQ